VDSAYEEYAFAGITQHVYAFFWNDFCDWYVEVSKAKVGDPRTGPSCLAVQDIVLRQTLLLLHPFCPFVTEELWHLLGFGRKGEHLQDVRPMGADEFEDALEDSGFPLDRGAVARVDEMREAVTLLRSLKAEYRLGNRKDVRLVAEESSLGLGGYADEVFAVLESQGGFEDIGIVSGAPESAPGVVTPLGTFHLDLAASLDVEAEQGRLNKELAKLEKAIDGSRKRLENPSFVDKAPDEVVEGARRQLEENERKRAEIERLLASLD
jgi:valyl-tRNA synthetase